MSNYLTVPRESPPHGAGSDDMRRRGRINKDGGGEASVFSSIVNILNTILGAGILTMPFVASQMGILPAVLLMVWCALTSGFGLYLQSRCARYLDRGASSFFALAQLTWPQASIGFDSAIAIKCFGVAVSYLIIIGDLMPGVVEGMYPAGASVPWLVSRNFWITAFMLPIMVLSFLKRLDSLRHTSLVALVSIGYLTVLVVYHFAADPPLKDPDQIRIITWAGPFAALGVFPILVFAYTCHQNMFAVLNEIKNNSPSNIMAVIGTSSGTACALYVLIAITGYLTFGNVVKGNIVMQYPNGLASTIGKASIVVLEMFSVPLQVHPCRASLDSIFKWRPARSSGRNRSLSPGGRPLLGGAPRADHGPVAMPELRFTVLTTLVLVGIYATALLVHNLDSVLSIVGATGSTSISFILPGYFYWSISNPNSPHHQRLLKDNDDAEEDGAGPSGAGESSEGEGGDSATLAGSGASIQSTASAASSRGGGWQKWRRRLRLDMDRIEPDLLRTLAFSLMCYGFAVCGVCLASRIVLGKGGH